LEITPTGHQKIFYDARPLGLMLRILATPLLPITYPVASVAAWLIHEGDQDDAASMVGHWLLPRERIYVATTKDYSGVTADGEHYDTSKLVKESWGLVTHELVKGLGDKEFDAKLKPYVVLGNDLNSRLRELNQLAAQCSDPETLDKKIKDTYQTL